MANFHGPVLTPLDNFNVLFDNDLSIEQLHILRTIDPNYQPNLLYPSNKTVIYKEPYQWWVLQLIIPLNKINVFISDNVADVFRSKIFDLLLRYTTLTIKEQFAYDVANDLNLSINLYVDKESDASCIDWWGSKFKKHLILTKTDCDQMSGSNLPVRCVKFTRFLSFNPDFTLRLSPKYCETAIQTDTAVISTLPPQI
jgi:hypothetical protein